MRFFIVSVFNAPFSRYNYSGTWPALPVSLITLDWLGSYWVGDFVVVGWLILLFIVTIGVAMNDLTFFCASITCTYDVFSGWIAVSSGRLTVSVQCNPILLALAVKATSGNILVRPGHYIDNDTQAIPPISGAGILYELRPQTSITWVSST